MTTIDKALKIAVETNNMPFLEWVFTQGEPANLSECLLLATEKGQMEQIAFLTKKLPPSAIVPQKRALQLTQHNVYCGHMQLYGIMSQLLCDLQLNKQKAEADLEEGIISKEEINYQNADGYTALHYVCNNVGSFSTPEKMVQKLLDAGADVNLLTKNNSTVLHCLCLNGSSEKVCEVAKILLKVPGIGTNMYNSSNVDAMQYIISSSVGDGKLFEILLNTPEYDVNNKDSYGNTALMILSRGYGSNENIVKMTKGFLNHPKIDVNAQDNSGMTALMLLCQFAESAKLPERASLFLAHPKIDLKIKNNDDKNVLNIACPNYEFFKSLSEKINA